MSAGISLLVIGGGPAGITAALQACELGAQATLVEAGQIGMTIDQVAELLAGAAHALQ